MKMTGGYGLDDADLAGPKPGKLPRKMRGLDKPLIDDKAALPLRDIPEPPPPPPKTFGEQFTDFFKPLFSHEDITEAAEGGPRNVMAEQAAKDIKAHPPAATGKPIGERAAQAAQIVKDGIVHLFKPDAEMTTKEGKAIVKAAKKAELAE
jgi:hypothetical protein